MGYRHPNPRLPKGHRSYFRSTDRRKTPDPAAIAIVVEAAQDAPGYFIARLLGDDREFARSRTPFCDAARKLLDHGISPAAMLVMRRARGTIDCLWAAIGVAARLTVEESAHGPVFRTYRTGPPTAVEAPGIRSGDPAGSAGQQPACRGATAGTAALRRGGR
jgi:hypothetical protein